jgi:hypothetical protein
MKFRLLLFAIVTPFFISCSPTSDTESRSPQQGPPVESAQSESEITNYIIGGRTVSASDPLRESIVSLINVRAGALCTASIIADDILLTAAHCVESKPQDLRIHFGLKVDTKNMRPVDSLKINKTWSVRARMDKNTGDIAVIKFSGGLPAGYNPVKMAPSRLELKKSEPVILAGFGLSNGENETGAGRLRVVEVPIFDPKFSESEVMLDQTSGKGACHGDSGGPGFINSGGIMYLWGVTSRGSGNSQDDCAGYSIYTKSTFYLKWIAQAAKELRKK